jgi:hypothetical protein
MKYLFKLFFYIFSKARHCVFTLIIYLPVKVLSVKEIPFREDFPCYSTWKRCKHSGHFSRFRIIIGSFCIVNQKCYIIMLKIHFKVNKVNIHVAAM